MKRPRWLTKADFERLRAMPVEEALAEADRLRKAYAAKQADWYQANREQYNANGAKYVRKNRKRTNAASRKHYAKLKEDPERYAAYLKRKLEYQRVRRAAKKYERTEAMREKDRRKRQRIKMQALARNDPMLLRKLIKTHVPGYLMVAAQMDVINAVMLQALDRKIPFNDLATWVKKAVTEYNRQFDHFKNVSIDAPFAGTDGLTRADLIDSEAFHF